MNKRQKKKCNFRKVIFTVKPGIYDNPKECPMFRAFSNAGLLKLIDKLKGIYDFEFVFVRTEFPYEKYRSSKG